MNDSSPRPPSKLPLPRWVLPIIALLLIGGPLGVNAALQLSPGSDSPATGHAQVVTQGIVEVAGDQVVWRLVERTARPRWEAIPARRVSGFILASEEPVLLSNYSEADASLSDIARLAPGEAMMVTDVTRTVRASFTDQSTKYLALELVPADEADDVGSGDLLFRSPAFTPPTGKRDVDLVRDVLALGESTSIPDSGQDNVVLATEGAIDVIPDDGRTTRLEAGESATFTGEFEVQAVQPGGANMVPVSAMTAYLAQDQASRTSFVVAVIGNEIPPPATPTETPTGTPPATLTAAATQTVAAIQTSAATLTAAATLTGTVTTNTTPGSGATSPPSATQPGGEPGRTPTVPNVEPPTSTPTAIPPKPTSPPPPRDSDTDGLSDTEEMTIYGTNPYDADSDDDRLTDYQEVVGYGTNPNNRNTDGDRCDDGMEVFSQGMFDPLVVDCPTNRE